jgi:hypothetical protein
MAAAIQCMPYCHARLVSAQINVRNEYAAVSDEELVRRIAQQRRLVADRMREATGRIIDIDAEVAETESEPAA